MMLFSADRTEAVLSNYSIVAAAVAAAAAVQQKLSGWGSGEV